jgi:hypothetical protein
MNKKWLLFLILGLFSFLICKPAPKTAETPTTDSTKPVDTIKSPTEETNRLADIMDDSTSAAQDDTGSYFNVAFDEKRKSTVDESPTITRYPQAIALALEDPTLRAFLEYLPFSGITAFRSNIPNNEWTCRIEESNQMIDDIIMDGNKKFVKKGLRPNERVYQLVQIVKSNKNKINKGLKDLKLTHFEVAKIASDNPDVIQTSNLVKEDLKLYVKPYYQDGQSLWQVSLLNSNRAIVKLYIADASGEVLSTSK